MDYIKKFKTLFKLTVLLFIIIFASNLVFASKESIDLDTIKWFAIPLHLLELALAIFISYMALKFFNITKPVNIFLVVYIVGGFFIINTLLYLLLYSFRLMGINISFLSVYIGSRVALIAMLISLGALFYHLDREIRKKV